MSDIIVIAAPLTLLTFTIKRCNVNDKQIIQMVIIILQD